MNTKKKAVKKSPGKKKPVSKAVTLNSLLSTKKPVTSRKVTTKKKPAKKKALAPYHINHQAWDRMAVMAVICERIIFTSLGLTEICEENKLLPSKKVIYDWLTEERKKGGETPVCDLYAHAKECQADYMAEEMIAIADDGSNDYMDKRNKEGDLIDRVLDAEHVQRSRLRIDTRKWIASKLKPKKYGDKLELSQDPARPLGEKSNEELIAHLAALTKQFNVLGLVLIK